MSKIQTQRSKKRRPLAQAPAQQIRESLEEIVRAKTSGDWSRIKVSASKVIQPSNFSPKDIKSLRQRVGVSQAFFAHLVGVSIELVESWEQGLREPRPIARRLLDEIARDPQRWRKMVRRSA
jgi:putative transcriptional regulator